jgi:hypothetical protein
MLKFIFISIVLIVGVASRSEADSIPLGIFVTNEKDCTLVHRDGFTDSCSESSWIYDGDKIRSQKKKFVELETNIEWKDRSALVITPETSTVKNIKYAEFSLSSKYPSTKDNWIQKLGKITGFSKNVGRRVAIASIHATKGKEETLQINQLPGNFATLLPKTAVTFSWCDTPSDGKSKLVIMNSTNKKVFDADVTGETSYSSFPEALSLVAGQLYDWKVEGAECAEGKIKLLSDKRATEIQEVLEEIGKTDVSAQDKLFGKAIYLQLISDKEPEEVNLYWLSYQLLSESGANQVEDARTADFLKSTSGIRACTK